MAPCSLISLESSAAAAVRFHPGRAVLPSSLLEQAQEGDSIITLEVSRLARSTKQLCEIIEIIKAKRLRLVIVGSITVDCSNEYYIGIRLCS